MVILSPLEEENLKQELLNILHASSDLILTIYDPAQKMLQYVTTNIEKLFGYKPQELIGTNLYPLQSSNIHSRKTKFGHCYNLEIVLITTLYNGNILSIERIIQKESPLPIDTNLTPMIIIDSFGKLLWSNSSMDGLVGEDHLKTYGGLFYNYVDKQEDYQKMIDQLLETKSELGRYPLKLKHQDGTMISVEVDSITSYLGDGQLLHTTLFFFEPPCITPSPSKLGYFSMSHLSLEIPFPPPPPCSPIDQSEIELSLPLNIRLDHSDSADSETKRRKSTPRVKVPSIESQFLAQMSHDIRTPVSGIIGMTSLLQMTSLTSEQKDFVDTIESSSSLLLALLNDILDLSKIEAGKVELECIPFSLPKVVIDCVKILSVEASKKDIPIIVTSTPPFADSVGEYMGDPNRIKQILMNFLSNAVKFTQNGQIQINVNMSPLEENSSSIGYWQDFDEIKIEVKDTGIGIADTSKLFSPFVQAALSTSRMYGGTGLGLSICKQLADIMGGQIGVHSVVDEGTNIWVTLRLEKAKDQLNHDSTAFRLSSTNSESLNLYHLPTDWRSTCSLLVAEDNIVNRKLLQHMLKRLGFHNIEMVENGKEAVELVAKSLKGYNQRQYHLILMDCQMPELDGYDATRIIREMEAEISRIDSRSTSNSPQLSPTTRPSSLSIGSAGRICNHIPIVALTANASESDRQACLSSGMDDFCTKPLTIEKLDDILSRWVSYSWSNT